MSVSLDHCLREAPRATLDSLPGGALLCQAAGGRLLAINRHLSDLLGYPPALLDHPDCTIHRLWAIPSQCGDLLDRVNRDGGLPEQATQMRQADGGLLPVTISGRLLSQGEPVALFLVTSLVPQLQASRALYESERRYRRLVENLPDPLVVHRQGRVIYANPAAAWLHGFPDPRDMEDFPVLDLVHPTSREAVRHSYEAAMSGHGPCPLRVHRMLNRQGGELDVEGFSLAINYGDQPAVLSFGRDVTAHEKAQRDLAASEHRLRSIMDRMGLVALILDKKGRVSYCNDHFLELTGYARDEAMGRDWSQNFLPESEREWVSQLFGLALREGRLAPQAQSSILTRDGRQLIISWHNTLLHDANQELVGVAAIGEEVTEEWRALRQLEESRQCLALAIDVTGARLFQLERDCLVLADHGGGLAEALSAILEISPDDLPQAPGEVVDWLEARLHPDDAADFRQGFAALAEARTDRFAQEWRMTDGQGRWRYLRGEMTIQSLDDQGRAKRLVGLLRDVSLRCQALEDLAQSEARYRGYVDHAPEGIYVVDSQGRYLDINPAASRQVGYAPEEIRRLTIRDLVLPEDLASSQADFARLLATGHTSGERRLRRADGSLVLVELSAVRTGPDRFMAFARDIGERRAMEDALREREEQYRSIFENVGDAIFIISPHGRVLQANQPACQLYASQRDELLSLTYQDLSPARHRQTLGGYLSRLEPDGSLRMETQHLRRDGVEFWVDLRASHIAFNGQDCVLLVVRDITARKQAEEQSRELEKRLLHAQKMEAIGTLAGGVAHDFNNILAAIIGYAELALDDAQQGCIYPDALQHIMSASKRARDLVRQILTFSRRSETELKPMNLNRVVEEAVALLSSTLPKTIQVQLELPPPPVRLLGDQSQIFQVIMNLAANSKDAMPEGGVLRLTTSLVELNADFCRTRPELSPGPHALLTVADSGQGMAADTLRQIYDPFFTTKQPGQGTGLGLSTVYGIVQTHRGLITCRSDLNQGTEFQVYFPVLDLETAESLEKYPAVGLPEAVGSESILLVDDEQFLLEMGTMNLSRHGYLVLTAASGEEAVEIFQKAPHAVDLVILDLGMPGMGGKQCLRELVRIDPQVKVMVTSGYAQDQDLEEIIGVGAQDFLAKPYRRADLLRKIRRLLDQKPRTASPLPSSRQDL